MGLFLPVSSAQWSPPRTCTQSTHTHTAHSAQRKAYSEEGALTNSTIFLPHSLFLPSPSLSLSFSAQIWLLGNSSAAKRRTKKGSSALIASAVTKVTFSPRRRRRRRQAVVAKRSSLEGKTLPPPPPLLLLMMLCKECVDSGRQVVCLAAAHMKRKRERERERERLSGDQAEMVANEENVCVCVPPVCGPAVVTRHVFHAFPGHNSQLGIKSQSLKPRERESSHEALKKV